MAIELQRLRKLPDGRVEVYRPMKNADGYYVLADRAVDPQHNRAVNQFYIKDISVVAARIRKGGVSLRMRGNLTNQPNLISANEIEILEAREGGDSPPDGVAEDPFVSFTEWSSDEDDRAYRDL